MPENRSAARVVARLQRENEQLRCAMQSQQVALAGAQSALASYSVRSSLGCVPCDHSLSYQPIVCALPHRSMCTTRSRALSA